ncbi:uncharacterized protein J4E92_009395 [Alternaria infectoria]|uniref:uncharacterized protein n=1 Tax=Alternaria infectoria TaxID=45303 RepID=UPI002220CA65|nr:uncharacterized protein J4E92_009395 [Alternaria infectoria]KAI4915441.1 hypothetical protein J4E92_009395 [Alternaria infectoria]
MLDIEDLLSDVLPNPEEIVYAIIDTHDKKPASSLPSELATSGEKDRTIRVRVITPELAHSNFEEIPMVSTHVSTTCTLLRLKGVVQEHLGLSTEHTGCPALECNCRLAQSIDESAVPNVNGTGDYDALRTAIVVHSNNIVVAIPVKDMKLSTIQQATNSHMIDTLHQDLTEKVINTVGGIEDASDQSDGDKNYLKAPVMAICSWRCRSRSTLEHAEDDVTQRTLVLDVHTSECPINITAHNAELTIEAAGLEDCAINGVLNIYAVQRWTLGRNESLGRGKAAIFKKSEAWKHRIGHTERGLASLLSTLRIFTELVGGMELRREDAVLRVVHLLTQFPPAVRAVRILTRGETPKLPERAALTQCLYEILKKVVPLLTVRSDPKRFFEGSRLLFGLILEKAKQLKITKQDSRLPYVGMKVYDLRNFITSQPVLSEAVQTTNGLASAGFYEAFKEQGLLRWTIENASKKVLAPDPVWDRIAKLSGGAREQVLVFNLDAIRTNTRYMDGGDIGKVISPAEWTDLTYLASLCSRNGLSVAPPASLASVSAPVLTLDRYGLLAAYLGRAGCAEAGKDMLIARPSSSHEEEVVDVSIITRLLEPILAQRKADGTLVFEAYGDHHRKLTDPEELTMICVDLSSSMNDRCGFIDIQHSEDADEETQRQIQSAEHAAQTLLPENPAFFLAGPDELKEYLRSHESYDDFLAIIGTGTDDYHCRQNAEKVLDILTQLHDQQIYAEREKLEKLREQASRSSFRNQSTSIDHDINVLNNRSLRLKKYRSLLCAWLMTCVGNASVSDPLLWKPGDEVPKIYQNLPRKVTTCPKFEIPREYCCPISGDIMQDPVTTVDNFTYERGDIERWLRTNERSPFTNLILPSNDLRPNVELQERIVAYLNGSDIVSKYALHGARASAPSQTLRVTLRSPLETRSMDVPRDLKAIELWEIAFRLIKGRYASYELRHQNAQVPATEEPVAAVIDTAHEVFVTPTTPMASTKEGDVEELCLVKIYRGDCHESPVVSYWVPKLSTQPLASTVFRYYRHRFTERSTSCVEEPFVFWTRMRDTGDGWYNGTPIHAHWTPISSYFNTQDSRGRVSHESCLSLSPQEDTRGGDELRRPHVFKLCLKHASSLSNYRVRLSRLDVLKQMFDAYINRLLAYNYQTRIGLVTFSTRPSLLQPITHSVENFRHKLNDMRATGDTAVWDSILLAQDQLQEYAKQYPKARLRIVVISDGEDNKSNNRAHELPLGLFRNGIVVDSFCLGTYADHTDIKTISYLTGGYAFQPASLEDAMAICEMEPVLSLLERPDKSPARSVRHTSFMANPSTYQFRLAQDMGKIEKVSRDEFPDRKQHPQLNDSFVELGHFSKSASVTRTDNNVRLSRIHNEIRNSGAKPHPYYDVYVCESNMGLWKIAMQGPPDSTYAGGTFLLYLEMGNNYPRSPPEARFITPIYHPNINRHGRICHSILDRNWTLDTSTKDVIDTIYSLLLVPEFSDPINAVVTLDYHWDEIQFKEEAQKHLEEHASMTREDYRDEIVGVRF